MAIVLPPPTLLFGLFPADVEFFSERHVALVLFAPDVSQQTSPLTDHLEQSSSRGFIIFMSAQVLGELRYAVGEKGYLDFR